MSNKELDQIIKSTKTEMQKMAKSLNFIEAGKYRDKLFKLEAMRAKKADLVSPLLILQIVICD